MAIPDGGTNLGSGLGPVEAFLKNTSGNIVLARCLAASIPTSEGYAIGCMLQITDTGMTYVNVGTATVAAFSLASGSSTSVHPVKAAINATATATAAQVATGYITSTSAAATTITLPTGTLLGAALGATQGTTFDLYIDNTAGANTVTVAVAVNGILSDGAVTAGAVAFGDLTIASGVTGLGRFTIMFSSATAYVFSRTA